MEQKTQSIITLVIVIAVIIGAVVLLEKNKPEVKTTPGQASTIKTNNATKDMMHEPAKELVGIEGYINTDDTFNIQDLVGKQVVLVDFWTYSCINCKRTQPYLNDWQKKYGDKGLTIIGVHTPEFEFEKKIANVQKAVTDEEITYPVVLDNNYATWQAYQNRYWPRKYLIDINGFIVYDHIGEGAYDETEAKIQELLKERNIALGEDNEISEKIVKSTPEQRKPVSPETYFGASRNMTLANGQPGVVGVQTFNEVTNLAQSSVPYLEGTWDIQEEYATNQNAPASIKFKYQGENVYFVASADSETPKPVSVSVLRDGQLVLQNAGEDVENSTVNIKDERLYHLIQNDDGGEHTLELQIHKPGAHAFTFIFG